MYSILITFIRNHGLSWVFPLQDFIKLDRDGNDCFLFFPGVLFTLLCEGNNCWFHLLWILWANNDFLQIQSAILKHESAAAPFVVAMHAGNFFLHRATPSPDMLCGRDIFSFLVTLLRKKKTSARTQTHTDTHAHTDLCIFSDVDLRLVQGLWNKRLCARRCCLMCFFFFFTSSGWLCDIKKQKANTHREGSWTRSLRLTPLRSSARFRKQLSLTG